MATVAARQMSGIKYPIVRRRLTFIVRERDGDGDKNSESGKHVSLQPLH